MRETASYVLGGVRIAFICTKTVAGTFHRFMALKSCGKNGVANGRREKKI